MVKVWTPYVYTLDQLPDVVLINLFGHLSHGDKVRMENVCSRFNQLMNEVWNKKEKIVFPYDIWQIDSKYPLSSYLDDFGLEMGVLIEHCPNLKELRFADFKRLQVFIQASCMTHFETYHSLHIREIYIGSKYVTDVDMIREMARIFPNLEVLSIMHPYPLVHKIRPDTMTVLRRRIPNLEPQLWSLIDDNARVTEDIRLYLELFPQLNVLRMKNANFDIVAPEDT